MKVRIMVVTHKTSAKYPDVDFEALKQKEMPFIMKWKEEGILEHFYIREDTNGAVLVFNNLTKDEVIAHVESLPFFPYFEKVEYTILHQIF